ncbi:unnamed protein product [Cercospora beticola]|nr:unnamed protein product [Cercospora beticola]
MPPSTRRPRHANPYARTRMNDDRHPARTPQYVSDDDDQELNASHIHEDLNAESGAEQDVAEGNEELPDSNPEDEDLEEADLPSEEEEEDAPFPGEDEEDEDEEDLDLDLPTDEPFPPPGLKEISSLASWTVSTAKPGNGVLALRHPSTTQFWQSDGPQPHTLNIHFFKLVSILRIRIFLDFLSDESYTPTKIQFLAGMGIHDLIDFAEMSFEQPTGWIDVDFGNVGGGSNTDSSSANDFRDEEDWDDENDPSHRNYWSKRPVLRAFLVQVRILENHQNGKDTHLRAVQIFARDDESAKKEMGGGGKTVPVVKKNGKGNAVQLPSRALKKEANNIKLADWMMNPDIR